MFPAKKVKQEGLLSCIWLQWAFAVPEMLEWWPHTPSLPVNSDTHLSFGGQEEDKWFIAPSSTSQCKEVTTIPRLGTLDSPNASLLPDIASARDLYPTVLDAQYRPTHCSEFEHHDGCSTSHVSQEVWTQGTSINSQILYEETEAAEASWLPKTKQELAFVYLACFFQGGPVCLEHTEFYRHKQYSWAFAAVSGGCGAIPSQHPRCSSWLGAWQSSVSQGQTLSHDKIINYVIKDHNLKEEFNLWGREKITVGNVMR